jgi:citrate synthase
VSADVQSGLEGVVAFATEIAEPDRDGGALRYRGVDLDELVGRVTYEQAWGLLVDGVLAPVLPPAGASPALVPSGDRAPSSRPCWPCWPPPGACGR